MTFTKPIFYPFLDRSGSIETFFAALIAVFLRVKSIHF